MLLKHLGDIWVSEDDILVSHLLLYFQKGKLNECGADCTGRSLCVDSKTNRSTFLHYSACFYKYDVSLNAQWNLNEQAAIPDPAATQNIIMNPRLLI